jgi:hypothetical protein
MIENPSEYAIGGLLIGVTVFNILVAWYYKHWGRNQEAVTEPQRFRIVIHNTQIYNSYPYQRHNNRLRANSQNKRSPRSQDKPTT